MRESVCPGCRLRMPFEPGWVSHRYLNCSAECWRVFGEVLAVEYSDGFVFGQVHQLAVDAYAAQHPGGSHPDKSIFVHLAGLYGAFELQLPPHRIPSLRQRLTEVMTEWPHFRPPAACGPMTAFDVALAASPEEHMVRVRKWASFVWAAWTAHRPDLLPRLANIWQVCQTVEKSVPPDRLSR